MRWSITPKLIFVVLVDGLHEQTLDLWQGEGFFRKGVKFGFGQNLCQRCNAFNSCATGDQPVRPLPSVAFFIIGDAIFKLLLFVPELGKLALIVNDLGFQFRDGFLLFHSV